MKGNIPLGKLSRVFQGTCDTFCARSTPSSMCHCDKPLQKTVVLDSSVFNSNATVKNPLPFNYGVFEVPIYPFKSFNADDRGFASSTRHTTGQIH